MAKADANQNEPLQINSEISDPVLKDLEELEKVKKRLLEEHEEKEKKARRREKWRRILGLGFFSKK